MLTYMEVHLHYTLPPTVFLWLILKPLIGKFDKIKILVLCTIAVIYTTPWDNYIIYRRAWWYRKKSVIGTIGLVPIEEYFFFIIQTIFTSLWTMLCTRWTMHALCLRKTSSRVNFYFKRYVVLASLILATISCWIYSDPKTKLFYSTAIGWWVFPVTAFLWFVCGYYISQQWMAIMISIAIPTFYLWGVDLIVLRDGVWHINEDTSLEYFFFNDLPIEEMAFFLGTNTLVVFGCMAFDKSKAVLDTYFEDTGMQELVRHVKFSEELWITIRHLIKGAFLNEIDLPETVIDDLEHCIRILDRKSKSFSISSIFFSNDIKQDLTIIYAFCRVTDDMIDNIQSVDLKKKRLAVILKFLNQVFKNRKVKNLFEWREKKDSERSIDWKYFESNLSVKELAAFRSLSRISYYLPHEPFYELTEGYKWDIEEKPIKNETDLMEYSKYVASSVATLCTFVLCYKSNRWPDNFGPACQYLIENARKMGLVLQITNICRDIITDSEVLGRCYIPLEYLHEKEFDVLVKQRNPSLIENYMLKQYAEKMLALADKLANESIYSITSLPQQCQRPILSALQIYRGIGKAIRKNQFYERRASLSTFHKLKIIFECMYLTRIESLK